MKKTKAKVDVIIVSHNNKDILGGCLDSIKKQTYSQYLVYLLDNDSNDGTEGFIKKTYPKVKFFDIPKTGPAAKRNMGMSMSNSEYILLMDSDAQLTPNWLKEAVEYMDLHKDVGLCNGKILSKDGKIDSAGGLIARNSGAIDVGFGEEDVGQYETFKRAGYLKSATLIIRRSVFKEIGGFDPDYYYGCEDTDLGLRANISGWKVIYNPNLVSYHLGHNTMAKTPFKREIFMVQRNKLLTYLKNYELETIVLYSPMMVVSFFYWIIFKKYGKETFRAYLWNLRHFKETFEKRRKVQENRKISDSSLFDSVYFPMLIRGEHKKKNMFLEFFNRVKNNKKASNLTFFITTRCNARCKHCFYWKELNQTRELTLKEIELLLSKFDRLDSVLLSGGEPFIRKDFVELVDLIVKYNNPDTISIPTNSLMGDKIIENLNTVLTKYPKTNFAIICSIDGMEEHHDSIRGVKGTFKKVVELIQKLKKLKTKYPNFKFIAANTVMTAQNKEDIPKLVEFIKTLDIDDHFFDIIRGEHKGLLNLPNKEELRKLNSLRYNTKKYYNAKKHKSILKRIYTNLRERHVIITQMEVLEGKKWPFKCTAGITDLVLESDGTMRICELNPKIGDLLKKSPKELLESTQSKKIFEMIQNHKCDCTHVCNVSSSMEHDLKDILIGRFIIDSFKKFKYFR